MKRIVAAALAACVLLGGCGVIRENREAGAIVSTSALDMSANEGTGRVLTSAVYFYNGTSKTLTAEPRNLVIETDANPAEAAVEALLEGPYASSGLTGVAPEGMTLESVEFSRGVANVYLRYGGDPMPSKDQYILEQAIANTVTDILGASYIRVFFNGLQTGLNGAPSAPLKKQTGSVEDAWTQAEAKSAVARLVLTGDAAPAEPETTPQISAAPAGPAEPFTMDMQAVMYYLSADGGYLLPEVHTVQFTQGQCVQALIAELKKTPNNAALMQSPLSEDVKLLDAALTLQADGTWALSLNFSGRMYLDAEAAAPACAAVIYTVTGFIPNVKTVEILAAGKPITGAGEALSAGGGAARSDFNGYIGSSALLYFDDRNSDMLLEVSRSMEQGKTWSARARVLELLNGPLKGDGDDVLPVMPPGVKAEDIRSVDVYGDTAYVDLSQHFKDACAGMSAKSEMLLVYAIVNTITAMDGIGKVQFLVEGAQTQQLAGTLCLADPFLKNYGIIKNNG
jgi:spore germination protein GerM